MSGQHVGLVAETRRQWQEGNRGAALDIWRHEGFKRGIEYLLQGLGATASGRELLERAAGGAVEDGRLHTSLGGLELEGPIGIGVGWDKTGRTILGWQALGARHITIGGVPLHPQVGNSMPRLYTFDRHVGDHGRALSLNSFGFYSLGAKKVVKIIGKQKETGNVHIPVIVQVTLNKEMYEPANRPKIPKRLAQTIRQVLPVADAISLGLSSPNTFGMRDAQDQEDYLRGVMSEAREATLLSDRKIPLAYKADHDGTESRLLNICDIALDCELDILELINSTALGWIKEKYGAAEMPGGLAGADPDFQNMALRAVKTAYAAVGGKIDIHGMGGVNSVDQAWKMHESGASAISINTGIRKLGRRAMTGIERDLSDKLNRAQVHSFDEIIGRHAGFGVAPKTLRKASGN